MYAWANHGWVTTVSTVLIGPWLLALATHHVPAKDTLFSIGPLHLRAASYPSLVVTAAAVLQLLTLPLLGVTADRVRSRRRWLEVTCVLGSVAAVLLAATGGGEYVVAALLFLAGSVAFGASNVLCNSFLPQIASSAERDAVSSRGFAYGYLGGGLLLAVNLALIEVHKTLGMSRSTAVRICFVSAGLWWSAFGLASLRGLRDRPPAASGTSASPTSASAVARLSAGVRLVWSMPQTRRYVIAFLLFSDAISAVIALSSTFITHELFGDSASRAASFLFILILLIQFIAMGGSAVAAVVAQRLGGKRTILVSLVIWCAVIFYAYAALRTKTQAVVVGVVIGTVLGGTQALARALFAQLIPPGLEATFFGLYEVANQGTSWIAPLLFTIVVTATGSFRQAILSLLILFVAGGVTLALTDVERAAAESTEVG